MEDNMKERYYVYVCSATKEQMEELENHLSMNGYKFAISETILIAHEEEADYIETIMVDRDIDYILDDIEWI